MGVITWIYEPRPATSTGYRGWLEAAGWITRWDAGWKSACPG